MQNRGWEIKKAETDNRFSGPPSLAEFLSELRHDKPMP
jgi:hypothetical protein